MDVNRLEQKILHSLAQNRIPLAVITIVGTTEEGSIDPVHEIQDLRKKLENEKDLSFWLHVDAAWGGYIKSLFNLSKEDELNAVIHNIAEKLDIPFENNYLNWNNEICKFVKNNVSEFTNQKYLDEEDQEIKLQLISDTEQDLYKDIENTNRDLNELVELKKS